MRERRRQLPFPKGAERRVRRLACAWLVFALAACVVWVGDAGGSQRPLTRRQQGLVKDLAPGKFLVATRHLPDPNFSETVILLAQFDTEGAMGLILNRRSEIPVSRALGTIRGADSRRDRVYLGGPVALEGAVALVRSQTAVPDARHVFDDVYLITTRAPLEAVVASGAGSDRFRVFLGYSGWGAEQLENETVSGAWYVFPADGRLVFDPDPDSMWDRQIRRSESLMALGRPRAGGVSSRFSSLPRQ